MTYLPDCGDGIDAPDCLTCEGTGGHMSLDDERELAADAACHAGMEGDF